MDHIGFKKVFTLGVSYTLEKARGQKNAHQQELSLLRPSGPLLFVDDLQVICSTEFFTYL